MAVFRDLERLDDEVKRRAPLRDLNEAHSRIRGLQRDVTKLKIKAAAWGGAVAALVEVVRLLVKHV